MPFIKVAMASSLPPGDLMEYERGDDLYAICNVNGELRALSGICPHQGGPLGEGTLSGELVTCPWHMWEFHSATGECVFNPDVRVPVFPVRVADGAIEVDLPDA